MPRQSRTIPMTPEGFAALKHIKALDGLSQTEILSRLIQWLAFLDRPARQLVMGTIPTDYLEDAARRLAEQSIQRVRLLEQQADQDLPPPETHGRRSA